eukprot:259974-Amphidinium_carterae.1
MQTHGIFECGSKLSELRVQSQTLVQVSFGAARNAVTSLVTGALCMMISIVNQQASRMYQVVTPIGPDISRLEICCISGKRPCSTITLPTHVPRRDAFNSVVQKPPSMIAHT